MTSLKPGKGLDLNDIAIEHHPVDQWQRVDRDPTAGSQVLDVSFGSQLGLWEMSEGTMLDVESDEVFLVISGAATLEFLTPALPAINLTLGSIVRLARGMRTRWTVTGQPFRKLYLMPATGSRQEHE